MIINQANIRSMSIGYSVIFNKALAETPTTYQQIATTVPSTTRDQSYNWLGQMPQMREWIGDREIQNLSAYDYVIKNKKFEMTIAVPRDDIEDDTYGVYNPMFQNLGECAARHPNEQWIVEKMTLRQHLDYKFILSLEGNDVASNLKWVMSSNSLAVMPRPTCETWFMEGRLIPNYHYVEIKPDFSDLEERLNYYIAHPQEAEEIIRHAHEYVEQFKDPERERLVSLFVLKKYFEETNSVTF